MANCAHHGCSRLAVGVDRRQTPAMAAPGFYGYCEAHAPDSETVAIEMTRQDLQILQRAVDALRVADLAEASKRGDAAGAPWAAEAEESFRLSCLLNEARASLNV